jgi:hypothetical protein
MVGRLPAVVERACRESLADGVTWRLRTAKPVEAGRLQCQLIARRVLKEEDAVLDEAMFSCSVCVDGCVSKPWRTLVSKMKTW